MPHRHPNSNNADARVEVEARRDREIGPCLDQLIAPTYPKRTNKSRLALSLVSGGVVVCRDKRSIFVVPPPIDRKMFWMSDEICMHGPWFLLFGFHCVAVVKNERRRSSSIAAAREIFVASQQAFWRHFLPAIFTSFFAKSLFPPFLPASFPQYLFPGPSHKIFLQLQYPLDRMLQFKPFALCHCILIPHRHRTNIYYSFYSS